MVFLVFHSVLFPHRQLRTLVFTVSNPHTLRRDAFWHLYGERFIFLQLLPEKIPNKLGFRLPGHGIKTTKGFYL